MHGEEQGRHRRHDVGRADQPSAMKVLRGAPGEDGDETDVERVEQYAGEVEAEGRSAPQGAVDGVRKGHRRPGRIAPEDVMQVRQVGEHRILDDQPVVVVDERVVQRVGVDDHGQGHGRGAGGHATPCRRCAATRMVVCRARDGHRAFRAAIVYAGWIAASFERSRDTGRAGPHAPSVDPPCHAVRGRGLGVRRHSARGRRPHPRPRRRRASRHGLRHRRQLSRDTPAIGPPQSRRTPGSAGLPESLEAPRLSLAVVHAGGAGGLPP